MLISKENNAQMAQVSSKHAIVNHFFMYILLISNSMFSRAIRKTYTREFFKDFKYVDRL